jgi:hypothetical protein
MLSNQFNRLVVVANPASTHYKQTAKRVKELQAALPDVPCLTIETSAKGRQASLERLVKQVANLGPRSLLAIAAGDGTVTMVIEALLTHPQLSKVRDQPATTHIAACYVSFGATAFAAHRLNQPKHRHSWLHRLPGGRLLQELITITNAFIETPPFMVKEAETAKIVYERTFANGSRFAGINRLPIKLSDEAFYLHTIEKAKPITTLHRLTTSLRRKMSDSLLHDQADFVIDRDTYAQFDGEAINVAAGTAVHVQLSEQPFYALTTDPSKSGRQR